MSKLYPKVVPGTVVKVHQKIKEKTPKGEVKERVQIFEGMVLGRSGAGVSETITVRKIASGIGVEKIFPLEMPAIKKIEVVKSAKVRRAKLFYLRDYKKKLRFNREEKKVVFKKKRKKRKPALSEVEEKSAKKDEKKEEPKESPSAKATKDKEKTN